MRSRVRRCAWLAAILLEACARPHAGTGTATQPVQGEEATAGNERDASAERLAQQMQRLDRAVGTTRHAQIASVLNAMAGALATLEASDMPALQDLSGLIREFERSEPESVDEMRRLVAAVAPILNALDSMAAGAADSSTPSATQEARAALHRVSPRVDILAQAGAVRELMRAISDAVLVALGAAPELAVEDSKQIDEDAPAATTARDFPQAVELAEQMVFQLSQAGWAEGRRLAGSTMEALAAALAGLGDPPDLSAQIGELRFQAKRFRSADQMDFTRGGWAKQGLLAALFGLDRAVPSAKRPELAPWLESARAAISKIDDWGSLGFQRAQTQDAFRCVVDAFKFAVLTGSVGRNGKFREP